MTHKSRFLNVVRTGALVAVFGLISSLTFETAAYAQSSADVQARIRRLERDIRDLQAETFRRSPEGAPGATLPPPEPPAAEPPAQAMPDLGPMMRRVDELESSVTRLTGQMEELGYKIDQLTQQTQRMQKDLEFQASQRANAQAEAPPAGDQLASVAPAPDATLPPPAATTPSTPGVLGQIPTGST